MGYKLIAIGNILMGDEGIAVKVAEILRDELEFKDMEIIIGETDIDYCESHIEENDFIILLDATCFGIDPGSVTVMPLRKDVLNLQHRFTQHDLNMPRIIELENKSVTAYVIGIEVESIKFDKNLSSTLHTKLNEICGNVVKSILDLTNNFMDNKMEA